MMHATVEEDMAVLAPRVVFASGDLLVRAATSGRRDLCYVTFDSYTDNRVLERPGFGEAFFQSRGIDALHVISRDNLWYQHGELPEALAAVRAVTAGYDMVITYGSSMGGFAALNYGADCGATVGLAISPQFTIDPAVVPFENRWRADAARITFREDPVRPLALQYILYDPRDAQDEAHFRLFAERSPTIGLRVPFGGHPTGGYVQETEMFSALFEGVRAGALDPLAFEAELRARRRRSGQYFFTLSRRIPDIRMRQKLAAARQAVAVSAGDANYLSNLAVLLDRAGDYAQARVTHLVAIALTPGNFHVLHNYALHCELAGALAESRRLAERLVRENPDVPMLELTRRRVRRRQRQATPLGRIARDLRLDAALDRISDRFGFGASHEARPALLRRLWDGLVAAPAKRPSQ